MITLPKFLLVENFTWLIQQLSAFVDPNIKYKNQGLPGLKGGLRRIYRYNQHYEAYYQSAEIKKSTEHVNVNFGSVIIECDRWEVSHDTFEDKKLKEIYPKPDTGKYVVTVTSRDSFKNGTAKRYYVSCTCHDFAYTFKEELLNYGYTNGTVEKPSGGNGPRKLAPAICKHIYAVIKREYTDVLDNEPGAQESAEIAGSLGIDTLSGFDTTEPATEQPGPLPVVSKVPKSKKLTADKKLDYEAAIRRSLKFFSNNMRDAIESYHNTRDVQTAYKKYKFMVKHYPSGYVIVFTNPQLNPLRDKTREKELVPILNKTAKGFSPTVDSIVIYTKFFSKEELMDMIRSESRAIQQNQIDRLGKLHSKYTLTESLELVDGTSSIKTLLLGIY